MVRRRATVATAVSLAVLAMAGGGAGHHHGGVLGAMADGLSGGSSCSTLTADSMSPAANRQLADAMAKCMEGWGARQQGCLNTLWNGESGFDRFATYPSTDTPPSTPSADITTAYGIPQALPAQKMAAAGPDWRTNPATQIRWGLGYIHGRYGTPCAALAFKTSNGNQGY